MLRWCAVAVLLALPGVQACAQDASAQIDLVFPDDPDCSRQTPEGCPALPEADQPLVLHGELVWSWSYDACALDVIPSLSPIHVSFEPVERTARGWLAVTTSPREIYIQPQDQWDVTDDEVDPATGRFRAEERYPLDLIVSLVGEPSAEALESVGNTGGAAILFLKASTEQTTTFLASFALEQVMLDARPALAQAGAGQDAPAPSGAILVAWLALVALGLARRR